MSKNAYKFVILGLLTLITLAYTNCGQKSSLQFVSANSVGEQTAFSSTVYQITRANCIGCHETTSPTHASSDVNAALTAAKTKINWDTPENSRLVVKLRDENHNCWASCSESAEIMLNAIIEMKTMMTAAGQDPSGSPTNATYIATTESRAIQTELDDVANPQKSNTVRLNVEAAMVTAPMALLTDPVKGKYLSVDQTKNTTLAATDTTAGVAYLNFDVRVAGAYRVWMYVNAPTANDNGFYVRFDNTAAATTFDATVNGSDYGWQLVPNLNQNLTVGRHTLQIRERKDGAKINSVIVTSDTTFNGTDVGSFIGVTLSYDLSSILKVSDVKLMVDIADYDPYSYKILNPRIVSSTRNVHVKSMRILLNKFYSTQNSAFTGVEVITTPGMPAISSFSTVISKDKGLLIDKLSFDFEKLEITTATSLTTGGGGGGVVVDPAASLALFRTTVYPVSRTNCASCHTSQSPVHASVNAQIAHDTVLEDGNELVDFDSPTNSRIYKKVKINRHNCGSTANCDNIAAQYLQGIKTWGALYGY